MEALVAALQILEPAFRQYGILTLSYAVTTTTSAFPELFALTERVVDEYAGQIIHNEPRIQQAIETFLRTTFKDPNQFFLAFLILFDKVDRRTHDLTRIARLIITKLIELPDQNALDQEGNLRFVNGQLQYYNGQWITVLPEQTTQTFQRVLIEELVQFPNQDALEQEGNLRFVNNQLELFDGSSWQVVRTGVDGDDIEQGGNAFGTAMRIGTLDAHPIEFLTDGDVEMTLTVDGDLILGTGDNQVVLTPNPHVQFHTDSVTNAGWDVIDSTGTTLSQVRYDPNTTRFIWNNSQDWMALRQDGLFVIGGTGINTSNAMIVDPTNNTTYFQRPQSGDVYTLNFSNADGGQSTDGRLVYRGTGHQLAIIPNFAVGQTFVVDGENDYASIHGVASDTPSLRFVDGTATDTPARIAYHLNTDTMDFEVANSPHSVFSQNTNHSIITLGQFPVAADRTTINNGVILGGTESTEANVFIANPQNHTLTFQSENEGDDTSLIFRHTSGGGAIDAQIIQRGSSGSFAFFPDGDSNEVMTIDGTDFTTTITSYNTSIPASLTFLTPNTTETTEGGVEYEDNGHLHLITNGARHVTVNDAGQVGIGTSSPAQSLDVSGNTTVSGTLTIEGHTQKQPIWARTSLDIPINQIFPVPLFEGTPDQLVSIVVFWINPVTPVTHQLVDRRFDNNPPVRLLDLDTDGSGNVVARIENTNTNNSESVTINYGYWA